MSSTIEATPPVVRLVTPHDTVPGNRDAHGFGWACTHEMTVTEMVDRAKRCKCYSQDEACGECRSRQPGTMCEASGSDRAEYVTHVRGHGAKMMRASVPEIKLHRKSPAATLPKLKIDPLKWIEWTDYHRDAPVCDCGHHQDAHGPDTVTDQEGHWEPMEYTRTGRPKRRKPRYIPAVTHETDPGCTECDCTRPDYEIYGELRNAVRRGQFWAEASTSAVWVLPLAPAPWETARTLVKVSVSEIREAPEPAQADFDSLAAESESATVAEPVPVLAEIVTEDIAEEAEPADLIPVWDEDAQECREVPRAEAVAGMVRYARSLGPGSPACGEVERQALELARGEIDRAALDDTPAPKGATMIDARRETATDQPSLVAKYQAMGAKKAVELRQQSAVVRQREAVDGAQTLEYARRFLAHFAVWPSEAALTVATLWAAHAHARDAKKALVFLSTPRLLFSSAEPGSGKSHAMKLVSRLCPDPAVFVEPSEPALAQSIGTEKATIFLDEVDEFFTGRRKSACKAIVNDGAYPEGFWPRVRNGVTMRVPTFGALSMAGLDKVETAASGSMAATLSRCIRIRMRRAAEDYRAPRFDHKARFAAQVISERLGAWATQELDQIATYVPEMDGIGNRLADLYEPLYIIADIAGGPWPEMVRDAAAELIASGDMPPEDEEKAAKLDEIMSTWSNYSTEEE